DRPVELHDGRGKAEGELVVEADDLFPVRLLEGASTGVAGGDLGLQQVEVRFRGQGPGAVEGRQPALDVQAIPASPVLVGEADGVALGVDPGAESGSL